MFSKLILFLVLNFAALGIGAFLMGDGVPSEWYQTLNKAPWTPPGWVFGAAWTSIMVFFAFYMAYAWDSVENKQHLIALFSTQWVLNVFWNPVFFHFHWMIPSLVMILALAILMGYFFMFYWMELKFKSFLVLPYFVWLLIATSLNFYAYWYN